jgi:hypothetical protein
MVFALLVVAGAKKKGWQEFQLNLIHWYLTRIPETFHKPFSWFVIIFWEVFVAFNLTVGLLYLLICGFRKFAHRVWKSFKELI